MELSRVGGSDAVAGGRNETIKFGFQKSVLLGNGSTLDIAEMGRLYPGFRGREFPRLFLSPGKARLTLDPRSKKRKIMEMALCLVEECAV